jgi:site-specific DNA-cytosine methylase
MPAKTKEAHDEAGELVSLFCCAGGLDLGFEQAGYSVAVAVDLRDSSIESYNHNRTNKTGRVGDVTKLTPSKLRTFMKFRKLASPPVTHGSTVMIRTSPCASLGRLIVRARSTRLLRMSAVFRISRRASSIWSFFEAMRAIQPFHHSRPSALSSRMAVSPLPKK